MLRSVTSSPSDCNLCQFVLKPQNSKERAAFVSPSRLQSAPMSTLQPALPHASFLARFWPTNTTRPERSSLIAGGLGWMLDAMDVMLYSLVLAYLIREFSMSTRTAGLLNSLTLVA